MYVPFQAMQCSDAGLFVPARRAQQAAHQPGGDERGRHPLLPRPRLHGADADAVGAGARRVRRGLRHVRSHQGGPRADGRRRQRIAASAERYEYVLVYVTCS